MPVPELIEKSEWIAKTTVEGKERSARLKAVDEALEAYQNGRTPSKLEAVSRSLEAWLTSKTWLGHLWTSRQQEPFLELRQDLLEAMELKDDLWNGAYPGIYIGSATYRDKCWVPDKFAGTARIALARIAQRTVGERLLRNISAECSRDSKNMKVVVDYGESSKAAPLYPVTAENRRLLWRPISEGGVGLAAAMMLSSRLTNLSGMGVVVTWNPDQPDALAVGGAAPREPYIGLAHEMIHAYHYVRGICARKVAGLAGAWVGKMPDDGLAEEELRTVGLGPYADESPSENEIRKENGVALRDTYARGVSFGEVKRTRCSHPAPRVSFHPVSLAARVP